MMPHTLDYGPPPAPRRPRLTWPYLRLPLLLFAVLVPVEVACAFLAHHTLGKLDSGLYFLLVIVGNAVPLTLIFFHRRAALTTVIGLATLIIPYQLLLGVRWWRVHREAERIVRHLYAREAATGQFPADLGGYRFRDAGMADLISYQRDAPRGPFQVVYSIGTPTTSHWYAPADGWSYYPD